MVLPATANTGRGRSAGATMPAIRQGGPAGRLRLAGLAGLAGVAVLGWGALIGCSSSGPVLDQAALKAALLTERELPEAGWRLVEASDRAPTPMPSTGLAPLADGPCRNALGLLDSLGQGSTDYVKASYAKEGQPVVEVMLATYAKPPQELATMTETIRACPTGRLHQGGGDYPFTLATQDYPTSKGIGARLTVSTDEGPRVLDVALARVDRTVVTATAAGVDQSGSSVLDQILAAQLRKLPRS